MKHTINKQHGFTALELVIIVVVIGLLAGGGWFVYQHNRSKVTSAAASNNQPTTHAPSSTRPSADQSVVYIPELGIEVTVPNDIKDLTYSVGTDTLHDGRSETYARFSTKAIAAIDSNCNASFGPLGALSRISGQYPTTFSDSSPAIDYGVLVKQYSNFFISSGGSQAACSTNSSAADAIGKFKSEFLSAFPTIQQMSTSSTDTN